MSPTTSSGALTTNLSQEDGIDHCLYESSAERQDVYTDNLQQAPGFRHQRALATTLYLLTTSLLFADQNLLSPNLSAIASEFNLDEVQRDAMLGGDIAIAFFMIGVPASFVVGCLADVLERRSKLFLWVILIGEGACVATYWVATYNQLYWCRALTGASVGGALPLIYSVLGDYYTSNERGWVSGAISMGCGIGISFGQGVAGVLGPKYGWRVPFLVVGFPAVLCAFLVWLLIEEVQRGQADRFAMVMNTARGNDTQAEDASLEMRELGSCNALDECQLQSTDQVKNGSGAYVKLDKQSSTASKSDDSVVYTKCEKITAYASVFQEKNLKPHLTTLKALFRCPSVILAIFQGAPGCIPWGIINTYLNDYLSSDRDMSIEGATVVILVFGIGNFVGTIVGGIGGSHIYVNYGPRYTAVLSGGAAIAGCFPMWVMINYPLGGPIMLLGVVSFSAGAMSAVTGPIVKSTLQNVTQPQMRGMAFALLNTCDDFGRGLGPAVVASLVVIFGRQKAFNLGILGWIFCGILNGMLFFTVEQDEEKARAKVFFLAQASEQIPQNIW